MKLLKNLWANPCKNFRIFNQYFCNYTSFWMFTKYSKESFDWMHFYSNRIEEKSYHHDYQRVIEGPMKTIEISFPKDNNVEKKYCMMETSVDDKFKIATLTSILNNESLNVLVYETY